MAESGADVVFDIVLLLIAAVAAVLWNAGVISKVITSGITSDPTLQVFLLLVFAIVLAEVYIVNTDAVRAKLNRLFAGKKGDFYEKARAQMKQQG